MSDPVPAEGGDSWTLVDLGSSLYQPVLTPIPAPDLGKLEDLPIDRPEFDWTRFERLQWVILHDVEGLRDAQLYGDRGQRQFGLDVIALAADGTGAALQSKDYQQFHPSDLEAAVRKFQNTKRPFHVQRLIIGVSSDIRSTHVQDKLIELRRELDPVTVELWDKKAISRMLRDQPKIVIEFFGEETAQRFCNSFTTQAIVVPDEDAVAVQDAVARTPEVTTGARVLVDQADGETDPAIALTLIDEAQRLLAKAGYPAHADALESTRSKLLANTGRADEAARALLDQVWLACDLGRTSTAQVTHHHLAELARSSSQSEDVMSRVRAAIKASEAVLHLHGNPLGTPPDPTAWSSLDPTDRFRLLIIAGETALANNNLDWLASAARQLDECLHSPWRKLHAAETWEVRGRLLLAESGSGWAEILDAARRHKLPHEMCALVAARYARHVALRQEFRQADQQWEEAVGEACLAQRWAAAAEWVFSRRVFQGRWNPFTSDALLPIQLALIDKGPSQGIVAVDTEALSTARAALLNDERRTAAIEAQRALRDAVTSGSWGAEMDSCRLLGAILAPAEPELAAEYLVRAGDRKGMRALAARHTNRFIDVTTQLSAPAYWTVAAAYNLLAEEADLIPDKMVNDIAQQLLVDLRAAEDGTLIDLRSFAISRYLHAVKLLGALSTRLEGSTAEAVLGHFEAQPEVETDHYRYHDKDEAIVIAGIARTHEGLRARAIRHLVPLLSRSQQARCPATSTVVDEYFDDTKPLLQSLDDSWAHEQLAYHDPALVKPADVESALRRICAPIKHPPGVFTHGTNAVADSLLLRGLDGDRLDPAIQALLAKAEDPRADSSDRAQYLLAAANLADEVSPAERGNHFDTAIACATSPCDSLADQLSTGFTHPLGAVRMSLADDARPQAAYLAARLATTAKQRAVVRDIAFSLLGEPGVDESWLARTLICIQDSLVADTAFLSGRGPALRGLAAELWGPVGAPAPVGLRLARDDIAAVRRSLAAHLGAGTEAQETVRALLEEDPSHQVRAALSDRS